MKGDKVRKRSRLSGLIRFTRVMRCASSCKIIRIMGLVKDRLNKINLIFVFCNFVKLI